MTAAALVPTRQIDPAMMAGSFVVPASPITTADDLAAAFLAGYGPATRAAYGRDLRCWGEFLARAGVDVLDAHRVHADAFCREAETAGIAPATLARRLAALAGFYGYAVDEGLIGRSPVARVRRPKVSDESPRLGLDRDEMRAIFAAAEAKPRDAALVALLGLNGLRVSEALAADIGDLGSERGHRTLRVKGKGGKLALIPLAPRTAAAVDALVGDRKLSAPIFVTRTGARLDRYGVHKIVRRLARTAGISKVISAHSFRHSAVTLALDAGVSLRDVQDLARHADPRTTRRYDRGRNSLDRHATYGLAAFIAE